MVAQNVFAHLFSCGVVHKYWTEVRGCEQLRLRWTEGTDERALCDFALGEFKESKLIGYIRMVPCMSWFRTVTLGPGPVVPGIILGICLPVVRVLQVLVFLAY